METPGFDLSAAIETWRQELLAQPHLTPDDRRELETHLRDTMAELRALGLDNRDSFLLARRRTGPPQQIAVEYAKADPARIWRERVFWMAVAVFITWEWEITVRYLDFIIPMLCAVKMSFYPTSLFGQVAWFLSGPLFTYVPLFFCAVRLSQGRALKWPRWISFVFNTRRSLVASALLTVFLIRLGMMSSIWLANFRMNPHGRILASQILLVATLILDIPVIGLIAWFFPLRSARAPVPA